MPPSFALFPGCKIRLETGERRDEFPYQMYIDGSRSNGPINTSGCAMRRDVVGIALLVAGSSSATGTNPITANIKFVSGNSQTDTVDAVLAQPLVVQVTALAGKSAAGEAIRFFALSSGRNPNALINNQSSVTLALGSRPGRSRSRSRWAMLPAPGTSS